MRRAALALLCLCLLLSGGCGSLPRAREMGDMALLRTMGVDAAGDGVEITASTGPRARGLAGEGEPSVLLSAGGESLSGACLAMQQMSDSYVFFGYVDQLLLGEELARSGVQPVLDYFARDRELGLGAQLWLIRGASAGQAVACGGEEGVDARLSTLRTDGEMGTAAVPRSAGEVWAGLLEQGCAFVPALSPEEGTLVQRGYGVLRDGRLAGWLDGLAARGLELLAERAPAEILTVRLPENTLSVKITGVRTRPSLAFQGERPVGLEVACQVEAELTEYRQRPGAAQLRQVQEMLEGQVRTRLERALEQLKAWGADCAGLGPRAALTHPGKWRHIQDQWDWWFEELDAQTAVEVTVHG